MQRNLIAVWVIFCFFLLSIPSPAYSKSSEEARKELARMNIEFSKDKFFDRVRKGDIATINLFLDAGMNPNSKEDDKNMLTALHIAVGNGNIAAIKILLSRGADINSKAREGSTPLLLAITDDNAKIAKILIENGADVNLAMDQGMTPLIAAVMTGHVDIVKILLNKGVNINAKVQGYTALDVATSKKNDKIIKLLKTASGKNVTSQSKKKDSATTVTVADLADSPVDFSGGGREYAVEGYAYATEPDNIRLCENSSCGKGEGGDICVKLIIGDVPKTTVRQFLRTTNYCDRIPVNIMCTVWESGSKIYAEKIRLK